MSPLLPPITPALLSRADAASQRRGVETPNDAFTHSLKDSLANARNQERRSDADDAAAIRASRAAAQRSDVRALLLSGAMKFAVTRRDAPPENVRSPGLVASLPATPEADDRSDAIADDTLVPMSPIALPEDGAIDGQVPRTDFAPMARPEDTIIHSLPDDAVADSMPESAPQSAAIPDSVPDTWPVIDPAATAAAAVQLVAMLPLSRPPVALPDAPDGAPSERQAVGDDHPNARLDRGITSLPDRPSAGDDPSLVEDHFDAASVDIHTTSSARGVTAAAGGRTQEGRTDAPSTTSSRAAIDATPTAASVTTLRARGTTDRGIADLDPAFRERLERVMDRMQREFGHEVTVVETVRSQARQDALYAQGRTTPGPVVTWTRNSKHSQGRAADLMVDSAWENPLGYTHLAQIAKQEGLRTLGARDPGHVELPGDDAVSGETLSTLLHNLQGEASDGAQSYRATVGERSDAGSQASTMARVANVAQVARVATVASVAKVATVARPGEGSRDTAQPSDTMSPLAASGVAPMAGATELAGSVRVTAPASSVSMADRISHLMDLQASQAARPLSSVMLRMENGGGMEDQIRIDTRGNSVDARLGLGNAQQAAALTDRLGELREALERRGLTADGVRVQSTASIRTTDSANFSRTAAPVLELAAMRAASDSQAQGNMRDQSTRDQQQREAFARDSSRHTPRSSSDDTRHRSRREQPEDRR